MLRGPVSLHNVVGGAFRLPRQHGQHFVRGLTRVERRDQRLHDGDRAIVRPAIAPRLQVMRRGQMPVAKLAGLVLLQAQVDAQRGLLQAVPEPQLDGRVVRGIAAQDQQQIHRAGIQIFH